MYTTQTAIGENCSRLWSNAVTNDVTDRQRNLCQLLGIERPVLLAPMARVAGGALATAVSEAGGLGFLGGGYGDADWIAGQSKIAGDAKVGVGLISWHMGEEALDAALAIDPTAVWLSFGDPGPFIDAIHQSGALAVCQVGLVDEAIEAVEAGADVIVVQGTEAGGHGRPGRGLFGLLPAIADAIGDVPVIAAGGITDRRGLAAACALGASGVALGSALYATPEAIDSDAAKQRIVEASGDDTIHSRVYDHVRGPLWPTGYTGRTIRTDLTDEWAHREEELAAQIEPIRSSYQQAVENSDMSKRAVFAGGALDKIDAIEPAGDIIRRFPKPGANT